MPIEKGSTLVGTAFFYGYKLIQETLPMGITITKVKTQKWVKDNHSKGIFPNGEKIEYFLEYNTEKVSVPDLLAENEMTSQSTRDWFHGKVEMTVLMAEELGSHSLQGDLQAYLHINRQYESAHYDNPYNANIARMQGNTLSRAILDYRKKQ